MQKVTLSWQTVNPCKYSDLLDKNIRELDSMNRLVVSAEVFKGAANAC